MLLINYQFLIPLIVVLPLVVALLIVFIKNYIAAWSIAVVAIIADFLIILFLFLKVGTGVLSYNMGNFPPPFGIEYKLDTLTFAFLFLSTITAFLTIFWGKNDCRESVPHRTNLFISLLLFLYTGTLGMGISNDLFNIFVFMEISSLASYTLLALSSNKQAILYAFNFLIIGTITATFYVFGIGILYQLCGTLNIGQMEKLIVNLPVTPTFILAIAFITTGIVVKIGIFPVGAWMPKPYQLAPNVVTIFLSGVSVNIYIYLFMRIIIAMLDNDKNFSIHYFFNIFLVLSSLSILYYSFVALRQDSLKLLVAFSSLSQIGYILIGLVIMQPATIGASLFIIMVYTVLKLGLLMSIGNLMNLFGTDRISKLRGIARHAPFSYFAFLFFAFSLAGMPATSGLWAKLYLILSVAQSDYSYLSIILLIGTVFSFFYLWKPIKLMWINEKHTKNPTLQRKASWVANGIIAVLIFFSCIVTVYPSLTIYYCNKIAYLLLQG
ncbi:Na(+)/H(+) antiporter subunit D [Candidatus Hepatincola sp. Av]